MKFPARRRAMTVPDTGMVASLHRRRFPPRGCELVTPAHHCCRFCHLRGSIDAGYSFQ